MNGNPCEIVGPGAIRFYDNVVPTLDSADYLVNVTHEVDPAGSTIDEVFPAAQLFSVAGPRWSLPPADVFSLYPPNEAVGAFDQDLPHVVLTVRELPWERNVFGDSGPAQRTPWLALLVLEPEELLVADEKTANRTRSTAIPVASLIPTPAGDVHTYWPQGLEPEWYETEAIAAQNCTVIDIAPDTFTRLLPGKDTVRYFAHARQVDTSAKDAGVLAVTGDGWYSVVVAARLPAASTGGPLRSIAHLVSLEGLTDAVTDPSKLTDFQKVRLVSLAGWTFTCAGETSSTFAELVNGLDPRPFAAPVTPPSDADDPTLQAAENLGRGYVPLPWRTRLGEQTWGWYRGPFSPEPVTDYADPGQPSPQDTDWQPFGTASAALIYDKTWGVFDLSYAVAWETGRMLALADGAFSRALVDWGRRGHRLVDLIAERMHQAKALSTLSLDDEVTEEQVLALIKPYAVTDDFMRYLVGELGEQLVPLLTAPGDAPSSEPPFPPYPALPPAPADPQTLTGLMQETGIQEAIRGLGGAQLGAIADWLAQRYLLLGVPFEALVPDARLLPPESIRFFHVDVNWLDVLLEGALSIAVESSRDRVYQDLMKDLIWDSAIGSAGALRAKLLGGTLPSSGGEPEGMAGVLLRSAVVSAWAGLEVRGYAKPLSGGQPDPDSEIPLLRMDRPSSDVLLCLWPQVPEVVAVDEPSEGIAFGFEDAPAGHGDGRLWLDLRSLADAGYGVRTGQWVDCSAAVDDHRILELTALLQAMGSAGGLAVRDFTTRMIRVPEQALFAAKP